MTRRSTAPLLLAALSVSVLGGCFELTSSSTVDDDPAPYRPSNTNYNTPAGHWIDIGTTTNPLVVLGHEFKSATIQNGYADKGDLCTIYATVMFTAPYDEYLRFQAKITMSNGAWIKSPVFFNDRAGNREYNFSYNTANDGCWGGQQHYTGNLNVAACRGVDCNPNFKD